MLKCLTDNVASVFEYTILSEKLYSTLHCVWDGARKNCFFFMKSNIQLCVTMKQFCCFLYFILSMFLSVGKLSKRLLCWCFYKFQMLFNLSEHLGGVELFCVLFFCFSFSTKEFTIQIHFAGEKVSFETGKCTLFIWINFL